MKTVNTSSGPHIIESTEYTVISNELRKILKESRILAVDELIENDLSKYIQSKFTIEVNASQLYHITGTLLDLKERGINQLRYGAVLESLEKYDFVQLGNELFFMEINQVILQCLSQVELFDTRSRGVYQM